MAEQRLIDANAFKENMFKYAAPEMVWDMADIIHKINEMPSAQPERKNGKWIIEKVSGRWFCDQCLSPALKTDDGKENLSDFCPVCGADMRGTP